MKNHYSKEVEDAEIHAQGHESDFILLFFFYKMFCFFLTSDFWGVSLFFFVFLPVL